MDDIKRQYAQQLREYDEVVTAAIRTEDISQLPKVRELNAALAKTLNKMVEDLTFLKKQTPDIEQTRADLLDRLRRIQLDYNGLRGESDQLETLRRIRQSESQQSDRELYLYLIFFFIIAVCIVVLVLLMSPQKKAATAPSASMPPMAATLV